VTIREEDCQAAHLARALWLQHGGGFPVDIGRIALGYAFAFEYRHAPISFRGALYAELKLIVVNASLPTCQQRYVIAHELGHWLARTHQLRVRPARLERVCQLFAAHLLMPPDRVQASARARYGRADMLEGLAAEYLVTTSAMRIQLQQLGLLPGGDAQSVEKDIATTSGDPILTTAVAVADTPPEIVPLWEVDIDAVYRGRT
jgi:Zn-dependent peptidase ImmA (M78 family)